MDKKLLEMMGEMMERLTEVHSGMKDIRSEMKDMKTEVKDMKTEMNERFDAVDAKIYGVGEHFEELSKNTIQLQDDVKKELKYVTHKIHALDREVFLRTDSLQ
ncbi:hypothetical protein FITA111629_04420 [Filibacter tadaridae]|uniref:Uncharacterized protein n=1 Tax=Filibacter tadaridae TaxID=2483811 RepID=A0A3P5XCW0_9BACL|nr:hypothetical protein [Filibacter tadaridae]VDC32537.1 hypothetical protein FILTAD_02747 [Filibacter tadaridae]